MDRVNKREFFHNLKKYIKPGQFILTNRDIDEYVITIEPYKDLNVITSIDNVATKESWQ